MDVDPLNEPCPERLQFTPFGSFVVTVRFVVSPALTVWTLDAMLTVTAGGVVCVVGCEDDPPHPLSASPNSRVADNRTSIEGLGACLFRIPAFRGELLLKRNHFEFLMPNSRKSRQFS